MDEILDVCTSLHEGADVLVCTCRRGGVYVCAATRFCVCLSARVRDFTSSSQSVLLLTLPCFFVQDVGEMTMRTDPSIGNISAWAKQQARHDVDSCCSSCYEASGRLFQRLAITTTPMRKRHHREEPYRLRSRIAQGQQWLIEQETMTSILSRLFIGASRTS